MATKPTDLTPDQWKIIAHSGVITGYKCRWVSLDRIANALFWIAVGFSAGFMSCIVVGVLMQEIILP